MHRPNLPVSRCAPTRPTPALRGPRRITYAWMCVHFYHTTGFWLLSNDSLSTVCFRLETPSDIILSLVTLRQVTLRQVTLRQVTLIITVTLTLLVNLPKKVIKLVMKVITLIIEVINLMIWFTHKVKVKVKVKVISVTRLSVTRLSVTRLRMRDSA